MSVHTSTSTSTSIFHVEFPRVIYGVAKSYSRRASKATSTANSEKQCRSDSRSQESWRETFAFIWNIFFCQFFSHQALPHSHDQKVHIIATQINHFRKCYKMGYDVFIWTEQWHEIKFITIRCLFCLFSVTQLSDCSVLVHILPLLPAYDSSETKW